MLSSGFVVVPLGTVSGKNLVKKRKGIKLSHERSSLLIFFAAVGEQDMIVGASISKLCTV